MKQAKMIDRRHHIAIAHAAFLGGGAEAVTLWALQALQSKYKTTLVTLLPVDLAECNDCYGTQIDARKIEVLPLFRRSKLAEHLYSHTSMFTLRQQILARAVRKRRKSFDLLISTYNEMDLGSSGIQYIHSPFFSAYSSEARSILNFPDSLRRRFAKNFLGLLFGASERRLRQNLSITNSSWTASLLRKACNLESQVLYPPVFFQEPMECPQQRRIDGFLCIGRFARDKRLERAIEIIDRVRATGAQVNLRIVGNANDASYLMELEEIRKTRASWLTFEQKVSRSRLSELIREYNFGLQPREAEQFGIAVAEMAIGGCIPFVPIEGGQAEIVGNDQQLSFSGADDAAGKISRMMGDRNLQEQVRKTLHARQQQFSPESFMTNFLQLVGDVLHQHPEKLVQYRKADADYIKDA